MISRPLTLEEKRRVQRHPIFIEYSGQVPDHLRHLVYPDEHKPDEPAKRGRKPRDDSDNGDSN